MNTEKPTLLRTTYTLDLSRWRCGGNPKTPGYSMEEKVHGLRLDTLTAFSNKEGFMCCLGQFAEQKGIPSLAMFEVYTPYQLAELLRESYDRRFVGKKAIIGFYNTELARDCMSINDSIWLIGASEQDRDKLMTVLERLQKLTKKLWEAGLSLEVIDSENYAPEILKEYQDWTISAGVKP